MTRKPASRKMLLVRCWPSLGKELGVRGSDGGGRDAAAMGKQPVAVVDEFLVLMVLVCKLLFQQLTVTISAVNIRRRRLH
jgi:hypothetical protein